MIEPSRELKSHSWEASLRFEKEGPYESRVLWEEEILFGRRYVHGCILPKFFNHL